MNEELIDTWHTPSVILVCKTCMDANNQPIHPLEFENGKLFCPLHGENFGGSANELI